MNQGVLIHNLEMSVTLALFGLLIHNLEMSVTEKHVYCVYPANVIENVKIRPHKYNLQFVVLQIIKRESTYQEPGPRGA